MEDRALLLSRNIVFTTTTKNNRMKATCERVKPLAPGVIMARAVDKLKGDTIKFSLLTFLSSLYKSLLNAFEA